MPEQGSSFIPKSGVKKVQRTGGAKRVYVLAYLSYIVFFSTLFIVIGVYIYGATVTRSLNSTKDQLVVERQRFSLSDIENVEQLNQRLVMAEKLLDDSTAPSRLFSDIESIVASNIYFSGMTYEQLPNRQFRIDLVGRADDFNQVVAQEELIKNGSVLENATVVDYDYSVSEDAEGVLASNSTLSFVFSDTRDIAAIGYSPSSSSNNISSDSPASNENVVIINNAVPTTPVSTSTAPITESATTTESPTSATGTDSMTGS